MGINLRCRQPSIDGTQRLKIQVAYDSRIRASLTDSLAVAELRKQDIPLLRYAIFLMRVARLFKTIVKHVSNIARIVRLCALWYPECKLLARLTKRNGLITVTDIHLH